MLSSILISLIAAAPPAISLELHEFELPNGLKVILQPDPQEPMVAINLRYRVGSWWDPPQRQGMAHLVEHLMFARSAREDGLADLEASGAIGINAVTELDHTEYYGLFPPEVVPRALWVEAQRMAKLSDVAVQERLEREKRVVIQELRERLYDQAYGGIEAALQQHLFPEPHPLHHLPIGTEASVLAAQPAEVLRFHRQHYGPKHACLVVAGRFSVPEVRAIIEAYFGPIPGQEAPRAAPAPRPTLRAQPLLGPEWSSGYTRVSLVWHAPPLPSPASRVLELLAAMLNSGHTSRAGIANLNEDSIEALWAYRQETPAGGLFRVDAIVSPGASPMIARARVQSVIETYIDFKPDSEELQGTKTRLNVDLLRVIGDLGERASMLQVAQAEFGRPRAILELVGKWSEVSSTEIQETLNKTLIHEPQVAVARPVWR